MNEHEFLVGDAGGTNVRFAMAHVASGQVRLSDIWKRPGRDYRDYTQALDAYLADTGARPVGAALGLAGVTGGEQVELVNRGWTVELADVRQRIRGGRLVAVNDFHAMARSAPELEADDTIEIRAGKADPAGAIAVGGPGTGFGMAMLKRSRAGWIVVGGEGGHQSFGPQTELEWQVAEAMRRRGVDVSNELVSSGAGFALTRDSLAEVMGLSAPDLSQAEVTAAAEAGDEFALAFCRLRAATVMTALGDLAVLCLATGGVFIAGGVATHLIPWLREPLALARFSERGPRTELLSAIPISLIVDEAAPLRGAAHLWLDEEKRGWI